ncbi:IclR family transcriptional regulator [Virgibacillus byunsanensis]|uniref:IclR family transcriptional regulator n=1 Tax=Virgibacillus byunsanensis TaxID=570945 RepID=A0ABW3LI11_9BACI
MNSSNRNSVIEKAFTILFVFIDEQDEWGVRDLAKRLEYPTSTLHRMLRSLQDLGLLEYNSTTRKYEMGVELLRIGSVLSSKLDIKKLARPFLEQFVDEYKETICLVLYHRKTKKLMFVDQIIGPAPFQYVINLGELQPVPYGSSGKSILAFLESEEVEHILRIEDFSDDQKNNIRKELQTIRNNGVALSEGERVKGARGIAAPLFDSSGFPIGSVIFAAPIIQLEKDYETLLSLAIKEISTSISQKLGYVNAEANVKNHLELKKWKGE